MSGAERAFEGVRFEEEDEIDTTIEGITYHATPFDDHSTEIWTPSVQIWRTCAEQMPLTAYMHVIYYFRPEQAHGISQPVFDTELRRGFFVLHHWPTEMRLKNTTKHQERVFAL